MPSTRWPSAASSIESAITSRETSDASMPSVPMAMPSETAMVLNCTGVAPAARTPAQTSSASVRRCRLHGITSVHVEMTATSGFSSSASPRPVARSMARAGALDSPFFKASLRNALPPTKKKAPAPFHQGGG